ncbi:MAG: hypothetical protein KAT50_06085, partial [Pirellulales bacterium]|nr:hypothetical protein [Pirellulales bacterium]
FFSKSQCDATYLISHVLARANVNRIIAQKKNYLVTKEDVRSFIPCSENPYQSFFVQLQPVSCVAIIFQVLGTEFSVHQFLGSCD